MKVGTILIVTGVSLIVVSYYLMIFGIPTGFLRGYIPYGVEWGRMFGYLVYLGLFTVAIGIIYHVRSRGKRR